jgi:putative ABC transport system substrate-binding protein
MEFISTDGRDAQLREFAGSIVARSPDLIIVSGPAPSRAVVEATNSIPVVFVTGADPVRLGLVSRINRPGGNVTGISILTGDLNPKRLQLLRELVPRSKHVAVMANPTNPVGETQVKDIELAGRAIGLQLSIMRASTAEAITPALDRIADLKVDAILVNADPLFTSRRSMFIEFAARSSLPAVFPIREFVEDGGLMSYGTSINAANRLAGEYAGRVLKGERPGDLPVQQSTHFELLINARTAKALGIEVPMTLLATANEVIE